MIPNGNAQLCAVRALKIWLEKSGINSGAIFRRIHRGNHVSELGMTAESINTLLKNYAKMGRFAHPRPDAQRKFII